MPRDPIFWLRSFPLIRARSWSPHTYAHMHFSAGFVLVIRRSPPVNVDIPAVEDHTHVFLYRSNRTYYTHKQPPTSRTAQARSKKQVQAKATRKIHTRRTLTLDHSKVPTRPKPHSSLQCHRHSYTPHPWTTCIHAPLYPHHLLTSVSQRRSQKQSAVAVLRLLHLAEETPGVRHREEGNAQPKFAARPLLCVCRWRRCSFIRLRPAGTRRT